MTFYIIILLKYFKLSKSFLYYFENGEAQSSLGNLAILSTNPKHSRTDIERAENIAMLRHVTFLLFSRISICFTKVRDLDFTHCKDLVTSKLDDHRLLLYIKHEQHPFTYKHIYHLCWFDCNA